MEENTGKIKPFNQNDEQFLEAFVIFCGLGIQNTQMYEAVERAMAKQMVTLEVGTKLAGSGLLCHVWGFSFQTAVHGLWFWSFWSRWFPGEAVNIAAAVK